MVWRMGVAIATTCKLLRQTVRRGGWIYKFVLLSFRD